MTSITRRKTLAVTLNGARPGQRVNITYVDQERVAVSGVARNGLAAISDADANRADPRDRRRRTSAACRGAPTIDLPPEGVALIELD